MITITRHFEFEAAHKLENHPGKCANIHGHSYKLEVSISGTVLPDGMVLDFSEFKDIVQKNILVVLDHKYLNDIFPVPTAERIVVWIVNELFSLFEEISIGLMKVVLFETSNCSASWEREGLLK
jgi:6-pyruvoyltetrahydropterin/6-carboxytetrahydropterin synthase